MTEYGITVKHDTGGKRIEMQCEHHNGLVYVVPAEASWVCSEQLLHAHALAGFFRQLSELSSPEVDAAMQRWGIYYRERPLSASESKTGGGTGR